MPLALSENYYYFSSPVTEIKWFVKFCSTTHYILLATVKSIWEFELGFASLSHTSVSVHVRLTALKGRYPR